MLAPRAGPHVRPAPVPEPATHEIDEMLAQLHATSSRPAAASIHEPVSDVFDRAEEAAPDHAAVPAVADRMEAQSDGLAMESEPEPPHPPAPLRAAPEPRRRPVESGEHSLISAATTAAVDSAFNSLSQTVPVQNSRTLEDLVREMLRPMLKTWLDDNLPGVVERLVRAEIERVSRGRG